MIMITDNILKSINRCNLTLDEYYVLFKKTTGQTVSSYKPDNSVYLNLVDKGLLQKSRKISKAGRILIEELNEFASKQKKLTAHFDELWSTYPDSDEFGQYNLTRKFKSNKPKCKNYYCKIIADGYSPEDVLKSLKKEINHRKRNSITENKFKYMKNFDKWLLERVFEAWLDSDEESEKVEFINVL